MTGAAREIPDRRAAGAGADAGEVARAGEAPPAPEEIHVGEARSAGEPPADEPDAGGTAASGATVSQDAPPGAAPPAATAADPGAPEAAVLDDVAALTGQRDEYLGALQRLQADFANYRKRVLRQQEEQADRAAADLVNKLLPVLDALDLAEAHLPAHEQEADASGAKALTQARALLVDVLGKEGLERVDQAEVAFDPVVHDAVAHAPADDAGAAGETVIEEVLRSGYRWRGQVLRPAMVRVRG